LIYLLCLAAIFSKHFIIIEYNKMDPAAALVKHGCTTSNVISAEYIWIDSVYGLRSKSRTLPKFEHNANSLQLNPKNIPAWNYDGSSTGQAKTKISDIVLQPVAVFYDPFRGCPNIFVLCETFDLDGQPTETNNRAWAREIFDEDSLVEFRPWYGMEQEFFFLTPQGTPIGFPSDGKPDPQDKYYCGVGASNVFGREIMDEFYQMCLYSSIQISGINAEVANSQWEYQIGPCEGIAVGDHLWMARYIMARVAEKYGVDICYHPKPLGENWNGSGLHTNFSTSDMRDSGGIDEIKEAIKRLESRHKYHMEYYGEHNEKRLTGIHETSRFDTFTWGFSDRGASVRVPANVVKDGRGYLEDRRPAANADPYLVSALIFESIIFEEEINGA